MNVAVIIPTYNRPELLIRAINSVKNQTKKATEIIVVNDFPKGSLPLGLSDVTFVETTGQMGPAYARKFGIEFIKKSEAITYLDDDDELLPNHIELLSNRLSECKFAFSKALYKYSDGTETEDPEPNNTNPNKKYYNSQALLEQNIAPISSFMHTLEAYHLVGGWDSKMFRMEDWDLWGRMFIAFGPPSFVPIVTNIIHKGKVDNRTDSNPFVYSMGCSWRDLVSDKLKYLATGQSANKNFYAPRIGVLLPVYNAEKYLRQSLDSILNQTYTDFEIIAVDDCSTDSSLQILCEFEKKDQRVRVFRNDKNYGVSRTLNNCVLYSRSEYVARMDADDLSLPDRFKKQIDFLDENKNISILGSRFLSMNQDMTSVIWDNDVERTHEDICETLKTRCCIGHPTVMLRRKVFEVLGGYSENLEHKHVEDLEFWKRACCKFKFANLGEILLQYRTHPDQVSSKRLELQKINTSNLVREYE